MSQGNIIIAAHALTMDTRGSATVIVIFITFSSNISRIAVASEIVNSVDAITFGQKENKLIYGHNHSVSNFEKYLVHGSLMPA